MYELQIFTTFTIHYAVVTRLHYERSELLRPNFRVYDSVYRPVMRVAWGKIDSVLKEHSTATLHLISYSGNH